MPNMTDPFFSKSVVYICDHNQQGAMGIIINKQFKEPELKDIFDKLYIGDDAIYSFVNDIYFGSFCSAFDFYF